MDSISPHIFLLVESISLVFLFLLDTSVISELTKPTPHQRVVAWLNEHEEQFYFSARTLGEIEKGITQLPESKKKKRMRSWFENEILLRSQGEFSTLMSG
jgi:predicted nucleic acid-binding protein